MTAPAGPTPPPRLDAAALVRLAPQDWTTPRLRLAAPQPAFAGPFVESLNTSLPSLGYIGWGRRERSLEWAERFMAESRAWMDAGDTLVYYLFGRDDIGDDWLAGRYVGRVDLHSWDFDAPRCEVGYVGDVRASGRGLMREAVLACVQMVFTQLGVARVQALSEVGNTRALRFAEQALGFTREGVLRHFERDAHGRLGEQVMFATYNPDAR